MLAHQLAGYGRQGWKPQARLHCGAGWRRPPWAGQGAGPGSPTPGAAPSSPLARVLAAPGPRPRGFGLHPVGMIREPWSTLQGRGAPGSGTPSGSEQGRQAGAGLCLRNPLVPPPPHKAGSLRDPEMTPDHTAQRKHKATQLPRRKLDLGGRGRSLCPGLVGPGVTAGRTDAPGWPTNLGSPPRPHVQKAPCCFQTQQGRCSEAEKRVTRRAEGRARTQTRPLRAQLGGSFQRAAPPLDLAMVSQLRGPRDPHRCCLAWDWSWRRHGLDAPWKKEAQQADGGRRGI